MDTIFDFLSGHPDKPFLDKELKYACDSDKLSNIVKAIDGKKYKYEAALYYLSELDNLSMKLRVMSMPIGNPQDLMSALIALTPSDADKLNRLCADKMNPVLHFSMISGHETTIRILSCAKANLDVIGIVGSTPLTLSCESGLSDTVVELVKNGAKLFDKCDDSGFNPLHYASQLANFRIVNLLVKAGANVNALTSDGVMPIHLAISTFVASIRSKFSPNGIIWTPENAVRCIKFLAYNGADLDYVCSYGFSARPFLNSIKKDDFLDK